MQFLLTFFVLILIFGLVVFVHEAGHFLMAKKAGVVVEEFAFGFGPKLFSKMWQGTLYRINAIPLGGYVKMLGDEDGSSFVRVKQKEMKPEDKEAALTMLHDAGLNEDTSPYISIRDFVNEQKAKLEKSEYEKLFGYFKYDYIPNHPGNYDNVNFWPKVVILVAGVVMNFVLGTVLFYGYFMLDGYTVYFPKLGDPQLIAAETEDKFPILYEVYGTSEDDTEKPYLILAANGEKVNTEAELNRILTESQSSAVDLELFSFAKGTVYDRQFVLNGEGVSSSLDNDAANKVVFSEIEAGSVMAEAGITEGAVVKSFAGVEITTPEQLIAERDANKGKVVAVEYYDQTGKLASVNLEIPDPETGDPVLGTLLGVYNQEFFDEMLRINYGNNKAISGLAHSYNVNAINLSGLGELFRQSIAERSIEPVSQGVGSIVAVTDVTYNLVGVRDFSSVVNLAAVLSITIGFMNILPIPLLDGGNLLFLVIEKLRGKPFSDEFQERVGKVSFILLIIFSILVMFKDIFQFDWPQRLVNLISSIVK